MICKFWWVESSQGKVSKCIEGSEEWDIRSVPGLEDSLEEMGKEDCCVTESDAQDLISDCTDHGHNEGHDGSSGRKK
eukprot:1637842-Ditylum_brightwellii.AAC.1